MANIDFDPEDYVDEIASYYLIRELKSRKILPQSFDEYAKDKSNEELDISLRENRFPMREKLTSILKISCMSTLDDIIQAVKENYNK